jgi:DNA-binding response OmpR family regulator
MMDPARILIVDDDLSVRRMLREALEPQQYLLEEAGDGLEGLMKVMAFRPDLVLLGMRMPKMDGIKMCQHLQRDKSTEDIPIIMLSSESKRVCSMECLQSGANDYIAKPFEPNDLVARVERQLEIKEKLDRLASEKDELTLIQRLVRVLYEKKSMHDLLYTLVMQISDVIDVERCSFVRVRENGKTGVVEASSDDAGIRNLEIDLAKYPEIVEMLRTKKILFLQEIGKSDIMSSVREHLEEIKFQSLVLIPVLEGSRIAGTLLLRTAGRKTAFSPKEIRFLETITEAARAAILNVQGYEGLEDQILGDALDSTGFSECSAFDHAQDMVDECFRLKEEILSLKDLQQERRERNRSTSLQ